MATPLKKQKYYDFKTKMAVVFARKAGMPNKEIQQKFQIKDRKSIYIWVQWFQNGESYRLEQKPHHNYKYQKNSWFYQQQNKKLETIQKEIQKEIEKKTKNYQIINKAFYFQMIDKYRKEISLSALIKFFGLSRTSYYRWSIKKIIPQPSFLTNLDIQIRKICFQNRYQNYQGKNFFVLGHRKVYQELVNQNIKVNPKTVYLKMKKMHLLCQTRKNRYLKRYCNKTYIPISQLNLLKNNFQATRPFQKLCADVTYLPYNQNKFLYLSVIMDLYNREIISYHLSNKKDINLVLTPLSKLPTFKQPGLFHSDRGAEYTGKITQRILQEKNLIPSFSEKGSPAQNACVEAFFANFKCETVYLEKRKHLTKERLTQIVNAFIEKYNNQRRIKYLNYLSPYQFKNQQENQQPTLRS